MFFGRYLLREKIIDEEQLIKAVGLQLEGAPSLVRLLKREGLLADGQIVDLLEKSAVENISVFEAIGQVLSVDQVEQLRNLQLRESKGLAQILVNQGYVSFAKMGDCMRRYFLEVEAAPVALATPSGDEGVDEHIVQGVLNKDAGVLDFNMCGEFVGLFDRKILQKIGDRIKKLEDGMDGRAFGDICLDLNLLAVAAQMADLKVVLELLKSWQESLEQFSSGKRTLTAAGLSSLLVDFRNTIEFLWLLREEIAREKGEQFLVDSELWRERYVTSLARANSYRQLERKQAA